MMSAKSENRDFQSQDAHTEDSWDYAPSGSTRYESGYGALEPDESTNLEARTEFCTINRGLDEGVNSVQKANSSASPHNEDNRMRKNKSICLSNIDDARFLVTSMLDRELKCNVFEDRREAPKGEDSIASTDTRRSNSIGDSVEESASLDPAQPSIIEKIRVIDRKSKEDPKMGELTKMVRRIQDVKFKIDIESYIKEGMVKMRTITSKSPHADPSKKGSEEVDQKIKEIEAKIDFLRSVLRRHERAIDEVLQKDSECELSKIFGTEKYAPAYQGPLASKDKGTKFTGKLKIKVCKIRGLPKVENADDIYSVVKVDDVARARTKGTNGVWNERFYIVLERAGEIEVNICDGSNKLLGICWIRISDLENIMTFLSEKECSSANPRYADLTKEKRKESNLSQMRAPKSKSTDENTRNQFNYSNLFPIRRSSQSKTIEGWVPVEPEGHLFLGFSLTRTEKKENLMRNIVRLNRQNPVRKVVTHLGHRFVSLSLYSFRKCPVCREHMIGKAWYECIACKLCCHKKCKNDLFTPCIFSVAKDKEGDESNESIFMKHRVHHRFGSINVISAVWCSHCGCVISMGRKNAQKCVGCNVVLHNDCVSLSSTLCGISLQFVQGAKMLINDIVKSSQVGNSTVTSSEMPLSHKILEGGISDACLNKKVSKDREIFKYPSVVSVPNINVGKSSLDKKKFPSFGKGSLKLSFMGSDYKDSKSEVCAFSKNKSSRSGIEIKSSDFVFLSTIGRGNFGKVVLAADIYTRDLYAIKILQKDFIVTNDEVDSVNTEKKIFMLINESKNNFLTAFHSCFQTDAYIYFVMEFVPGGDLMWHIQHEQFSPARVKFYAIEVFIALEYLHNNNIIYRDLKLDNILLTLDGHVKLADYGLCKMNMTYKTLTNTFCGTPEFIAPEILLDKPYTRAVDWWAYGVLLYEMFFGRSPFQGETEDEIFKEIIGKEVKYIKEISPAAKSLLSKLLVKTPKKRLGYGPKGCSDIKKHIYFSKVAWKDYYELKVPPHYKPTQSTKTDTRNFDKEFTAELPAPDKPKRKLTKEEQKVFSEFTYVSEWVETRRAEAIANKKTLQGLSREEVVALIDQGLY